MSSFRDIAKAVRAVRADASGSSLYERFRADPDVLTVPVLDAGDRPVGLIERSVFILKMAAEYGRALYARRPISTLMDTDPLLVEADESLEAFTRRTLTDRPSDLMRGFIIVCEGRYLGVATALELLQVAHTRDLANVEALGESARRLEVARAEADEARRFMETVIENIPAMVFVKSAEDHRYVLLNKAGEDILGYPRTEVVGRTGADLYPPSLARAYAEQDRQVIASGQVMISEDERLVRKSGERVVLRTKKLAIHDGCGRPQYLLGVSEDITARKQAEARIAHLAHYDALTDLPNRILFRKDLQDALARSRRGGDGQVAVLCIDLDHFKTVNDTLGHPTGDALLKVVAERLRGCVREGDCVARLGGDEFAVVQSGANLPTGAGELAARIADAMAEPFLVLGHQVVIGASVGIAISPGDASEPDELLKKADMALYRVKDEGRGGFHFFEAAMDQRLQARRTLELDLRRAIAANEFELHYQPLMTLGTGMTGCCEALLRWRHPERGLVSPAEFIPLAEEIGLIVPLGEWVLRQACEDASTWPDPVKVAVNISPAQFRSRNLVGAVVSALANACLSPERLELEITESVLLQDNAANIEMLHGLRALGVRISMDDFGTGYSSLSYLRSFPFDKIKIDQSFVRDLPQDVDALAIIKAVTSLGASLGIATTAEGVETEGQLDELRRQGCDEIQGYLISRPVPAAQIAAQLGVRRGHVAIAAAPERLPQPGPAYAASTPNCSSARRA